MDVEIRTMTVKQRLLIACMAAVVLGAIVLGGCRRGPQQNANGSSWASGPISPISGMPSTRKNIARRPLAIMVENSTRARPQSGLIHADVVYEAITEGGITRFLAIFLSQDARVVGPVRSARPHFINLAREYNAGYVHCGQSYEALQILATDPTIYNLDQMIFSKPFWRDHSRRAPHNLYTSTAKLRAQMAKLRWEGPVNPLPNFTSSSKLTTGAPAKTIKIKFPGATHYSLRLEYDAKRGGYLRYMDGKLHVDRETRRPIVAKNVLIQRVYSVMFERSTHGTYDVEVVGSGKGVFVSVGRQINMLWAKTNNNAMTTFTDEENRSLPFLPGQTWVEVVPVDGVVTITPAS